ncbi:dihydrofolate reductase family protein [Pseudarthrobacter sp. R1]|nr:dihydrofolate reductase family protein [Pseudarthrobacter sp. R1]
MLTSLNSKISGPYMETPEAGPARGLYEVFYEKLETQAWLSGRVTTEEAFTNWRKPNLDPDAPVHPREDYAAVPDATFFHVVIDASGRVGWISNTIDYENRGPAHVIEVLTGKASDSYVSYLREHSISYIFAGEEDLDLLLAAQKLAQLFGIERLAVSGGGLINGSFLNAGLIDELSLVVAPVLDDDTSSNTTFERPSGLPSTPPSGFSLISADIVEGDTLWLRYQAQPQRTRLP